MESAHHIDVQDQAGKWVGVQTAILAVLLSIFTIFAHREHTNTLLYSNEAANSWSHYQAKRIRAYQVEMNTGLVKLLAPNSTETAATLKEYGEQSEKYHKDLEEIKTQAEHKEKQSESAHHKAGLFDLAEGLLEIAVVLSSLYFIARKRMFPNLGLAMSIVGVLIGLAACFIS